MKETMQQKRSTSYVVKVIFTKIAVCFWQLRYPYLTNDRKIVVRNFADTILVKIVVKLQFFFSFFLVIEGQ